MKRSKYINSKILLVHLSSITKDIDTLSGCNAILLKRTNS